MDRCAGAAARLPESGRKDLAIQALARSETVSDLAARHGVSRKFVYQQTHKAVVAWDGAFLSAAPGRGSKPGYTWSRVDASRTDDGTLTFSGVVRLGVGALDRPRARWPQTPSCYAMTGWRRTDSGRPAANIRFSTATPTAASVCWAAKPRARSRGPITAL